MIFTGASYAEGNRKQTWESFTELNDNENAFH
jgi:hypothetical protein